MDNLIFEKLGYREEEDVYGLKISAFNKNVCMSVRVFAPGDALAAFIAELKNLLGQQSVVVFGDEDDDRQDCFKLMLTCDTGGSVEGRVFMKASYSTEWSDTACFAFTSTFMAVDKLSQGFDAFLLGETGSVLPLIENIAY